MPAPRAAGGGEVEPPLAAARRTRTCAARSCVRSAQEARALYRRAEEAGSRLLLQAFLPPGPDHDWFFHGYADRAGGVRGGGPGRKLHAWPRGAGLTAVGRWTPNPPVQALAERVVAELGYRGIFDLDFRRGDATGALPPARLQPAARRPVPALHRHGRARRGTRPAPGPDPPSAAARARRVPAGPSWWRTTRRSRPAPGAGGRELAWHARDDLAPGCRAVGAVVPPCRPPPAAPRPPGARPDPTTRRPAWSGRRRPTATATARGLPTDDPLTDDEKASSC